MTEPRDEDPRAGDGSEHPHGLAEAVREEIAEVVEHVPKPVRWTFGKLVWLSLASIVVLVVLAVVSAGLYLARRTEWVAQEAALFLNQSLARNSDLVIQMKDLRGNPFRGVTVVEPRVRFRDGGAPLLEAPTMRVSYSAWDLFVGRSRSVEVEIDRPVMHLVRGADGRLRLPKWKSVGGGKPASSDRIHIRMRNVSLSIAGIQDDVRGGRLDLTIRTAPLRFEVADLGWRSGPFATRLDRLRGAASLGDSVILRLDELRSPEVVASGRSSWRRDRPGRIVHADIARIEWRLLHRITGNKDLNVPGQGQLTLDLAGDREWRGRLAARAEFDSLPGEVHGDVLWRDGRLELAPVEAVTPAGHLRGHVKWAKTGWEVGGDVEHGDPSKWRAIHVPGWPAGDLNGRFRFVVDNRPRASDRLDATLGASEMVGWRADSADVVVDFPEVAADSFTVRMRRSGGRMTLHGRVGQHGWNGTWDAAGLPLEEWPDGKASGIHGHLTDGTGTVEQTDGRLLVNGRLGGTLTDWLGIHTASWSLSRFEGALLPSPDLKVVARLSDLLFLGVHFDSATAALHVGDRQVALEGVRAMAGDSTVTTAGNATWEKEGWSMTLDQGEAWSSQFHWKAESPIALRGDPKAVTFDRLELRDGDAHVSIAGKWALPGGSYEWTGRGERLDLARLGMPADWGLSGRMNAALEIHGNAGDAHWAFTASVSAPGTRGHTADSLHVDLAGAPATLDLRELRFGLGQGALLARGRVARMTTGVPDTLTGEGIQRWISSAAEWQGALTATDLPLDRIGLLVPAAEGVAGVLRGSATIGGRPGDPRFDTQATIEPAAWHDYRVDGVEVQANYHDGQLEVPQIRVTRAKVASLASGRMPLRLALGHKAEVPETPMSWTAQISNGDLALLPLFVPQIGTASGKFALEARLGGTARHPDLDGAVRVRDAVVRLAGREEVLEGVYADFHILPDRVRLDSLSARQGQHGRVTARGAVELEGLRLKSYRFDLHMRDFAAVDAGLYAAELDGDFVVTNGIRVNRETLPMVVGRANVRRAVVLFDFANQTEMQRLAAATQPLFWTYRIQVSAVQNLHWRPPNGDIEFSADLNVEQTRDSLIIFGDMVSLRGTYYFLSNRFDVAKANLTFDNVGGVDPILDAEATTRIAPGQGEIRGQTQDTQTHTITVTITGRANEPVLSFDDDKKDWDESAILQELTLYRFYDPTKGPSLTSLGDPLDNYLTRAINKSVSADLSRMFGNYVTEWAVERQRGGLLRGEGELVVSAGSQLSNRLSIKYSQVVPGFSRVYTSPVSTANLFERDVEAEYRINRFFYFTTEVAQRRGLGGTATNPSATSDFNVNLKARWEY